MDGEKLEEMLDIFSSFGVSFIIEDVTDDSLYGLDEPVCTIEFTTEDESYTVEIGDYSKMDEERYISIGDGNVYLAKVDPLDEFDAVRDDLFLHDQSLSYDEVTRITFEGAENYTIFYEEENTATYCSDDVYFTEQSGETLPLDSSRIGTYLESLTTLNPTDYVTYNVTEEELVAYNLVTPELTITVDYTTKDEDGMEVSDTFVLSVSRNPEELAAAEEAEANDEEPEDVTGYVRVGDSHIIYKISEYKCNNLLAASYNELRHRELLTADTEDIVQLDVTLEGESYTFLADGEDEDGAHIWKYGENEVEIDDLLSALEGVQVELSADFTNEKPTGKKEIGLTITLDREERSTVQLAFYRCDGVNCLAVADGESVAFVPRSDVVELIEAVNAIVLD